MVRTTERLSLLIWGIKMRFRDKLIRFMYGRYGYDKLSFFMFCVYFLIFVIRTFLAFSSSKVTRVISLTLLFASFALLALIVFRFLSKNIYARQRENAMYLRISKPVSEFFKRSFNRVRYIKTHRYRKCPHCKIFLRLPRKKGKHTVKCPRCKQDFDVNIVI